MKIFRDQIQQEVQLLQFPPKRIISLVPSQTELLADLGCADRVVGITKFCVHPNEWFRTKERIGGTKQLHLDKIRALQPDLIIANKEENDREQVEALARDFPVWVSEVKTLDDAIAMIKDVGELVDGEKNALDLSAKIRKEFDALATFKSIRTAYLIWRNPFMTVGGDTFIQDILQQAGFENIFGNNVRYPTISREDLIAADPQLILLSSEPYPFKEKHIAEIQAFCPKAVIALVDGELFSWYGSRLLLSPQYICNFRAQREIT